MRATVRPVSTAAVLRCRAALRLIQAHAGPDIESDHVEADKALLACIDDAEVRRLYDEIDKWYA